MDVYESYGRRGEWRWRQRRAPWDIRVEPTPLLLLIPMAAIAIAAAIGIDIVVGHATTEVVTERCAQRWFEDTTSLGGLTVDYEQTSCDWSTPNAETVGCTVPVHDFEPAYIECVPVWETLVAGSCSCEMPPPDVAL